MQFPSAGLRRIEGPLSTGAARTARKGGKRKREEPHALAPQDAQSAAIVESYSRFQPPRLSPLDAVASEALRPVRGAKERSRAWRIFDRCLLLTEITGALVIAWLVSQYIYTVYFDTAPHRVTAAAGVVASATARSATRSTLTSTPTRVSEIAPPLVGTPDLSTERIEQGAVERPATTEQPPTATPTPTVDPQLLLPTRLRIPVMFLDSRIEEVTINMGVWQVSPMDIGHHKGTANPGEVGNVVLAGHRDINSALFRELDRLKPGDEVFVSNSLREYRYIVSESFVVGPTHTEVMAPTNDKRVTLITCTPIGLDTQRLIVTAFLDETQPGR